MSRISPESNRPTNPAKHFFEWSGKDGELTYYDKEQTRPDVAKIEAEIASLTVSLATTPDVAKKAVSDIINDLKKKKDSHNIPVKIPFTFIVLDIFVTLSGYNKSEKIGYYANEIKKTQKCLETAIFQVRSKNGLEAEGLYNNIKGALSGLKYVEIVYVAFIQDGQLSIGAIKMVGSSLSSWFNYVNGEKNPITKKLISPAHDCYKGAIVMSKGDEMINGETRYYPPSFTPKEIKAETNQKALELTAELEAYHKLYFAYQFKPSVEKEVIAEHTPTPEQVDATFEKPVEKSAKEVAMAKQEEKSNAIEEDYSDLPW